MSFYKPKSYTILYSAYRVAAELRDKVKKSP